MWEDGPWIVMGDWNMDVAELEASKWQGKVDCEVVAPSAANEGWATSVQEVTPVDPSPTTLHWPVKLNNRRGRGQSGSDKGWPTTSQTSSQHWEPTDKPPLRASHAVAGFKSWAQQ